MDMERSPPFGSLNRSGLVVTEEDVVAGCGVVPDDKIPRGAFLGMYTGDLVHQHTFEQEAALGPSLCCVTIQVPGTKYSIKGRGRRDIMSFVNEPPPGRVANTVAVPLHFPSGNAIGYFAADDIPQNTELWVHYGDAVDRTYDVGLPADAPEDLEDAVTVLGERAMLDRGRYCAPRPCAIAATFPSALRPDPEKDSTLERCARRAVQELRSQTRSPSDRAKYDATLIGAMPLDASLSRNDFYAIADAFCATLDGAEAATDWWMTPHVLHRLCRPSVQRLLDELTQSRDDERFTHLAIDKDLSETEYMATALHLRRNKSVESISGLQGTLLSGYGLLELVHAMCEYEDDFGVTHARKGRGHGAWAINLGEYAFGGTEGCLVRRKGQTYQARYLEAKWSRPETAPYGVHLPPEFGHTREVGREQMHQECGWALLRLLRRGSNVSFCYMNAGKGCTVPLGMNATADVCGYLRTARLRTLVDHADEEDFDARIGMREVLRLNRQHEERWRFREEGGVPDRAREQIIVSIQSKINPARNPATHSAHNRAYLERHALRCRGATVVSGSGADPYPPETLSSVAVDARVARDCLRAWADGQTPWSPVTTAPVGRKRARETNARCDEHLVSSFGARRAVRACIDGIASGRQ